MDRRQKIAKNLKDANAEDARIEAKIAEIPDTDIQSLREQRKVAKKHAEDQQDAVSRASVKLKSAKRDKKQAEEERDRYLKEKGKGTKLAAELTVGSDVLRVFEQTLERLKKEELARVSDLMNEIFLDMIGSDGEQGAIIRKAIISAEFDIVVYGPDSRLLSPDRDLNGASRRALTLAFILALTKVSEVEAPNIIDTPLGMMSGYVKSSVVEAAAKYHASWFCSSRARRSLGRSVCLNGTLARSSPSPTPLTIPGCWYTSLPSGHYRCCGAIVRMTQAAAYASGAWTSPNPRKELRSNPNLRRPEMSERLTNPFVTMEINAPVEFQEHFRRFSQTTGASSVGELDRKPFPRMVDFWFIALCVAVKKGLKPVSFEGMQTYKAVEGPQIASPEWRAHALKLIAIAETGNPEVVKEPRRVLEDRERAGLRWDATCT